MPAFSVNNSFKAYILLIVYYFLQSITHRNVVFRFLFVAHGYNSQHQVDEVERTEKYDDSEKYHTHGTTSGHNLQIE